MEQLRVALSDWPTDAQLGLRLLVVLAAYVLGRSGLRLWVSNAEASGEHIAQRTVALLWFGAALIAAFSVAAYSLDLTYLPLAVNWGGALTQWFGARFAGVVGVVAIAYLALTLVQFFVRRITPSDTFTRRSVRIETLRGVLASGLRVLIVGFTLVAVLGQLGVNVTALLAGVSVLGLAVSFGAQSLVKDVITGFFILFEDHYGVGDVVRINGAGGLAGAVEAVSLRTTVLRDLEGTAHILPNSQIATVSVLSKEWARAVMDVQVNFGVPADTAIAMVAKVANGLFNDPEWKGIFLEPPEVLGVQEIGASGIKVRALLKVLPKEQWAVSREFLRRMKNDFDAAGIAAPLPAMSLTVAAPLVAPSNTPTSAPVPEKGETPTGLQPGAALRAGPTAIGNVDVQPGGMPAEPSVAPPALTPATGAVAPPGSATAPAVTITAVVADAPAEVPSQTGERGGER